MTVAQRKAVKKNCDEVMQTGPGLKDHHKIKNIKPSYTLTGSLTVEASLVIPIFLFTMFLILSVINLLRFHLNLQEAVHQEAKRLSVVAYEKWNFSEGTIKEAVLSGIDNRVIKVAGVKNGRAGIDFSESKVNNRELIEINAAYEAELPYDFFDLFDYCFVAKCVMHTYIGYENGLSERTLNKEEEEYVYVTETGTVFHRDRECTYLRLSVKEVDRDKVNGLRNNSGHKYYPCKSCGKKMGNTVYITSDGTCYHGSLSCKGLKRTVYCIPISQVGGRGPCSRCGKKH
ncbi:MAG: pilus assembly protein [Lachnospiraceae bacterium]|nr:pilus assembly protein [Lachnospiraceae bacterium]